LSLKTGNGNIVMNGGNVGIGTNNPSSYTLQVAGSVGASSSFTRTTGSTGVAFAAPGTGLASTDYNFILTGANDTANRLVVFVNGSARTADGGVSNVTIRNDAGSLILGNASYPTIVYGQVGIGTATNLNCPFTIYNSASTSTYTGTTAWGNIHLMPQGTNNSWAGITFGGSGSGTIQQSTQASITVDSNSSVGTNMRFNVGYLFASGALERMTILGQTGQVGIGTSTNFNSAFKHFVYGGDSSYTLYGPNATYSAYLAVGAGSTYAGAGRASVTCSNGNLHIDNATGGFQIYLNFFQGGGAGGVNASTGCYGAFFATGDITAFYSDERLKTKVGRIENALDKVCSLTAFKYVHNDIAKQNGFDGDDVQVGLSAQEVQKVLPEVVARAPFDMGTEYDVGLGKSKSGQDYLTLKYERLVPLLVEAIKEERAERLKVDESLRTTNERLARLEKLLLKE
jgi:hypothetical protein